jgi:hypothetical protein
MGIFGRRLAERQSDPAGRRWLLPPTDQLSDGLGPLCREDPHGRFSPVAERAAANCAEPGRRGLPAVGGKALDV